MTLVKAYKVCPFCKRKYSWNPDAGRIFCPYCRPDGRKMTPGISDKKKKDSEKRW